MYSDVNTHLTILRAVRYNMKVMHVYFKELPLGLLANPKIVLCILHLLNINPFILFVSQSMSILYFSINFTDHQLGLVN